MASASLRTVFAMLGNWINSEIVDGEESAIGGIGGKYCREGVAWVVDRV